MRTIVYFLILLMIPSVLSFEWGNSCINNITLQRSLNYTNCNSTVCDVGNSTFYKNCEFGCDNVTQTCKPSPSNVNLSFLIIFGGMAFIIIIILIIKKLK